MSPDVVQLARFRARFGENRFRSISPEYFEWKHRRNPYLPGYIYLERRGEEVIGSASITPKKLLVLGQIVLGGEFCDAFTDARHRREGIFSRGMQAGIEYAATHGIQMLYGTPSLGSASYQGFLRKLGCELCPSARLHYMAKPLRPLKPFLKLGVKAVVKRRTRRSQPFRMLCRQVFGRTPCPPAQRDGQPLRISVLDRLAEDFDGLWGPPRYAFCTLRDRTYLTWRFLDNPDDYLLLGAHEGRDFQGYLAVKLSPDGATGVICDYITLHDNQLVFQGLLCEVERMLIERKVRQLVTYCMEGSPYFQTLETHCFADRGAERGLCVVVHSGTDLARRLLASSQPWHFTLADSDNI